MLAWIFGDCREGQIPRCSAVLQVCPVVFYKHYRKLILSVQLLYRALYRNRLQALRPPSTAAGTAVLFQRLPAAAALAAVAITQQQIAHL